MTWCADEFGEANFGDARLTKRFIGISQSVLDRPSASLSAACGDWAGAKGAYRFFEIEKVTPEEMQRPHLMKVKSRSNGRNVVLAVQDSTYLNLDSFRCMQGLGFVEGSSTWAHKGLVFHPSLAFSTEGECLGLLGYKLYSRSETRVFGRHDYMLKPIHEKESFRWIQTLEKNVDAIPKNCDVVTIGDRESDIYELFDTADKLNSFYLVRGSIDRYVYSEEYPGRREGTISDLTSKPVAKKMFDLELQATKGRKARTASVEVSYFQTKLKPPQRRCTARIGELKPLEVSVCTVVEINPSKGENALRSILFTNHPIDSIDEACERVNWYKQR